MRAFIISLLASATLVLHAEDMETTTKMRIKEVPEKQFFCAKKQIKIAEVGQFAGETIPALAKKALELKLAQSGPIVLSYIGFKGDPEEPFTIVARFPVPAADDDYRGDFFFEKTPKFKCASLIYQGPVKGIGEAWGKLVSEAMAAGHQPTGESREVLLGWESADSSNNIVELQFGVQ